MQSKQCNSMIMLIYSETDTRRRDRTVGRANRGFMSINFCLEFNSKLGCPLQCSAVQSTSINKTSIFIDQLCGAKVSICNSRVWMEHVKSVATLISWLVLHFVWMCQERALQAEPDSILVQCTNTVAYRR